MNLNRLYVFKSIFQNAFLFFVLLAVIRSCTNNLVYLAIPICGLFWFWRVRDSSAIIITFILLLIGYSQNYIPEWQGNQGRVLSISNQSAIVANGKRKIILYTEEPLPLDATISFKGSKKMLSFSSGFFSFNYEKMYYLKGIRECIYPNSVKIIQEGNTIRAKIQRRINRISDEGDRKLCNRILLGIHGDKGLLSSSLSESGFSMSGILVLFGFFMNHYINRRLCRIIFPTLILCFCIIYHFPFPLLQMLLNEILKETELSPPERLGITETIVLLLYPYASTSSAFLIPLLIRVANMIPGNRRVLRFVLQSMYQSVFFGEIKYLQIFLFTAFRLISGILQVIAFLRLWISQIPLTEIIKGFDFLIGLTDYFSIKGSMKGPGLFVFVPICTMIVKNRYTILKIGILFYMFLLSGLFHPCTEIVFLNVGQGDSIFIKGAFLTETYLIDTGKPKQYAHVQSFLDAVGVRKLTTLFITHSDDDHNGSMKSIQDDYTPEMILSEHFERYDGKRLSFIDLNTIKNENENQSSLVMYTEINKMKILLMGDADQITEEKVIQKYTGLECNLLKCSHHGSKTGNSEKFLDRIRPSLAIISAGNFSQYRHPSPEVINRLKNRRINYLNTHDEGDIAIIFLPLFNLLVSSNGKIGIIWI